MIINNKIINNTDKQNNKSSVIKTNMTVDTYNIAMEAHMIEKHESIESVVSNSFFYSNNKIFERMDISEILSHIIKKYPLFSTENKDSVIKRTLIEIINDDEFIIETLNKYDITIFDLFKLFCKQYASLFKGQYLKKLRSKLETKSYAQNMFKTR